MSYKVYSLDSYNTNDSISLIAPKDNHHFEIGANIGFPGELNLMLGLQYGKTRIRASGGLFTDAAGGEFELGYQVYNSKNLVMYLTIPFGYYISDYNSIINVNPHPVKQNSVWFPIFHFDQSLYSGVAINLKEKGFDCSLGVIAADYYSNSKDDIAFPILYIHIGYVYSF